MTGYDQGRKLMLLWTLWELSNHRRCDPFCHGSLPQRKLLDNSAVRRLPFGPIGLHLTYSLRALQIFRLGEIILSVNQKISDQIFKMSLEK